MMVIASLIAVAAVVLAVAISPTVYRGQTSTPTRTSTGSQPPVLTDQCHKADANAKYPLILQIWTPDGEPVKRAWIILYDWDRGIPFEEGYNFDNGTYISRHSYSPSQNMTLMIQNDQNFQNYVVNFVIPDIVCADGYIHVEVRTS